MKARARPGLHIGWVLLGAAVIGGGAGVIIAERQQRRAEEQVDAMQDQVERLTPQGDPAIPPAESVDPMAPDPASLRGVPAYPGGVPRRLMDTPSGQGIPMAISWFSTQDSADKVLSFYEQRFAADGLPAVSHRYTPHLGYVAWLERFPQRDGGLPQGIMHMVSAVQQTSQTMVLVSASEPARMFAAMPPLPDGVVVPGEAQQPFVVDSSELGHARQTVFVTVNSTLEDVVSFYDAALKQGGWEVREETKAAERWSLTAARGDQLQVLVASPAQDGDGIDVIITNEHRPAKPGREDMQ